MKIKFSLLLLILNGFAFGGLSHAKSLDRARELSAQIQTITNGRINVINPSADDNLFNDPQAIQNLNSVLEEVVLIPNLYKMSQEEVGKALVLALGMVTQLNPSQRASKQDLNINLTAATQTFCSLSESPSHLFDQGLAFSQCVEQYVEQYIEKMFKKRLREHGLLPLQKSL